MTKTAYLYIRVSTDEQADKGYSQRHQEEVLQNYCRNNDLVVRKVIMEDHSAKTFNRPAWKQMLLLLKKTIKNRPDLILFTKWDRFSRNAADAYGMIRTLDDFGVTPYAIEQPLDLEVPENKIMLAIYLAAPEVENDRRSLNVINGMRKGKREGRYMGRAPLGYINKISSKGDKYICPVEPQASLVRDVFREVAEGQFNVSAILKNARLKGFKCSKTNIWIVLKNPVYCGKIPISEYKKEKSQFVDGQHTPIITMELFDRVQKVLNKKTKEPTNKKYAVNPALILRGFLNCPRCKKVLTGSRSKVRYYYYHYYHCNSICGYRSRADQLNELFTDELAKWKPILQFLPLFKLILKGMFLKDKVTAAENRTELLRQLGQQDRRLHKARELLLMEDIDIKDFQIIKANYEHRVAEINDTLEQYPDYTAKFERSIENKGNHLLDLLGFYRVADITIQRKLIGHLFPDNVIFDGQTLEFPLNKNGFQLMYKRM